MHLATVLAAAALAAAQSYVEAGPDGVLKGTMLQAGPKAPIVVMIPGSGPTDRDGNNPLGVKAATLKLLAEGLAERGVSSVRIDKRGMFASAGAGDANNVTIDDYAADMHAWAKAVRERTGSPCVWLLGHSEGALVALATAQEPEEVCGLVLVSGMGRPFDQVLMEQLAAAPGAAALAPRARAILDELKAGKTVDVTDDPRPLQALFRPAVQGFLISLLRDDPAKLLAAYKGPVLVLQGTTDLQVSPVDAERLASARAGVKLVELAGVNHVLKVAPADRAANIATYADPSLPLAPGVAEAVANFVKAH